MQIVYYIVANNELLYARNFKYDSKEKAQTDLKNTYNDIKDKKDITNIKFTENELQFNDHEEVHTMTIIK